MDAWKEACSMRKCGKEPSRVDLASYFASHLNGDAEKGAVAEEAEEATPPGRMVPAIYSGAVASKRRSKAEACLHLSTFMAMKEPKFGSYTDAGSAACLWR